MTVSQVYSQGVKKLNDGAVSDCKTDAMLILKYVFSFDTAKYLLNAHEQACETLIEKYNELIERRLSGEPVQYIFGEWDFCGYTYAVGEGVLIPRPETEQLCERVDGIIKAQNIKTVYDLCAGSGCIGLTLALNNPQIFVYLFELSETACEYIKKNIRLHNVKNAKLIKADILKKYTGDIENPDLIVSNPPYICSAEIAGLQQEVKREPIMALDGGEDGLIFYRAIAENWMPRCKFAAVECGEGQADTIAEYFSVDMITSIEEDFYASGRFVVGSKK